MSKIKSIANLQYTNKERTNILMTVTLEGETQTPPYDGVPFPFHYVPGDPAPVTQLVKAELDSGKYEVAPHIPAEPQVNPFAPVPGVESGKSSVIAD